MSCVVQSCAVLHIKHCHLVHDIRTDRDHDMRFPQICHASAFFFDSNRDRTRTNETFIDRFSRFEASAAGLDAGSIVMPFCSG